MDGLHIERSDVVYINTKDLQRLADVKTGTSSAHRKVQNTSEEVPSVWTVAARFSSLPSLWLLDNAFILHSDTMNVN